MAGLWIAHVNVTDEERYGRYVAEASRIIPAHGGEFLARGGRYEQMEGDDHSRNVVVRFPTYADAVACYRSDDYQAVVDDAIAASERSIVIVEIPD